MEGNIDEARRLQAEARGLYEALGQRFRIALRSLIAADIELLSNRPAEASAVLRWAYDELSAMGAQSVIGTISAFLADALCDERRWEEAERFSRISEQQAPSADVAAQILWRISRARATGEVQLALEAVRLAAPTDYLEVKARAFAAAGDIEEARRQYELKGNVVAAGRLATQVLPS
jgi:hypothetical protein